MPKQVSVITHTYISDTSDVYILCETTDDHFEAYHIDLDSPDPVLNGPVMRYCFTKVAGLPVTNFHARPSSHKEKIDLNKIEMFFMMHGTTLFCFSKGTLKVVSENAYQLVYQNEEKIYFRSQRKI